MTLPTNNASLLTAVARSQQNLPSPRYVFGGSGGASGTTYGLFKKSSSYVFNLWRSQTFEIGKDFDVISISFNLIPDLDSNTSIIPVLYFDDGTTSVIGNTINNTNYANTNKLIVLEAKNFGNSVHGKNNFFLELQFTGSTLAVVSLPIFIDLDIQDT